MTINFVQPRCIKCKALMSFEKVAWLVVLVCHHCGHSTLVEDELKEQEGGLDGSTESFAHFKTGRI